MAVNKNFVVKNGLEVNETLLVANIDDSRVGVGTSMPNQVLHVQGGIGVTDVWVTGVSTFFSDVTIGTSGSIFAVKDSSNMVGVGTDSPAYLLDVQGPAGTGYTSLYVKGDVRVTGDIVADDLVFDQGVFTNLEVTGITTTSELIVGYGASITGVTTVGFATATDVWVSGTLTATSFDGVGQIGIGSEGTPIGSGVTFLNIASSTGAAIAMDPPTSGIATVTITPGASIGLAIALGG